MVVVVAFGPVVLAGGVGPQPPGSSFPGVMAANDEKGGLKRGGISDMFLPRRMGVQAGGGTLTL